MDHKKGLPAPQGAGPSSSFSKRRTEVPEAETHTLKKELNKIKKELTDTNIKVKQLEEEKNDLMYRLSSHASARMAYNNPNMIDLSDQNNPTKITERFSELYDNQWTNAFLILEKKHLLSETDIISVLLDVLYVSFTECKRARSLRESAFKVIAEYIGAVGDDQDVRVLEVMRTLKDVRKKSVGEISQTFKKSVAERLSTKMIYKDKLPDIKPYMDECVEICTAMNIQEPPLELRGVRVSSDIEFEISAFKPYTVSDLLPGLREIAPRERSSARHLTCRGMGATYSSESNDAVNAGHSTSHNEVEQGVETKDNTTSNGSIGRQETNSQPDQSQEQNVLDTNLEITEDDERRIKRMSEVDTLRWRLKVLEEENKKLHDELSQKEITIIELRQDADRRPTRQIGGYTQVQRKCERLYIEMDALKGKLKQCELFITSLKAGKLNNEKTIIGLRDENCELRSRLSIISSDRPIHAYTDIPSLSDKTRPSRLTEKMSELYDNQWIDAFNEIKTMGVEDENAIGILLKILMETNEVCKDMVSSHYQKLKEACTCFEYSSSADAEYIEKGTIVMTGNINYEMQQGINSIWRESSTKLLHKVIPIIGRKVAEQFDIPLVQMTQTSLYMKECAELCWMMNIQDKPMHLDVIVPEKDGHKYFKSEKFRSYTKTGRHVAFVVWPALYLFEGGSLLKKGVAQGLNFRKSKSGQYHSNVPRS